MSQEQQQQQPAERHDEMVAEVFGLVVEHCPDFNFLKDMCNLLMASATVRQQLLRVQGHACLELHAVPGETQGSWTEHGDWLTGFMTWLPRHTGLVDSLAARSCDRSSPADMQSMQRWVAVALQLARTSAAAAAAQGSAAAEADAPSPHALRLRSVTMTSKRADGVMFQPLLQELAFTHTRKLVLQNVSLGPGNKYASLLGRLTELQELECGVLEPPAVLALPASLRRLVACFVPGSTESSGSTGSSSCLLDVRHLTQLHTLGCTRGSLLSWEEDKVIDGLPQPGDSVLRRLEARLPPQLVHLEAATPLHLSTTGGSGALRSVLLSPVNMQLLPSLSGLPGPWALHLHAHTGILYSTWQDQMQAVAAIGASKGLTCLNVRGFYAPNGLPGVQWCPALLALPQLRLLCLARMHLQTQDLLGLTGLTQLRSLCLAGVEGCDDALAVLLANSLTGLTSLQLRTDNIDSQHEDPVCRNWQPADWPAGAVNTG